MSKKNYAAFITVEGPRGTDVPQWAGKRRSHAAHDVEKLEETLRDSFTLEKPAQPKTAEAINDALNRVFAHADKFGPDYFLLFISAMGYDKSNEHIFLPGVGGHSESYPLLQQVKRHGASQYHVYLFVQACYPPEFGKEGADGAGDTAKRDTVAKTGRGDVYWSAIPGGHDRKMIDECSGTVEYFCDAFQPGCDLSDVFDKTTAKLKEEHDLKAEQLPTKRTLFDA